MVSNKKSNKISPAFKKSKQKAKKDTSETHNKRQLKTISKENIIDLSNNYENNGHIVNRNIVFSNNLDGQNFSFDRDKSNPAPGNTPFGGNTPFKSPETPGNEELPQFWKQEIELNPDLCQDNPQSDDVWSIERYDSKEISLDESDEWDQNFNSNDSGPSPKFGFNELWSKELEPTPLIITPKAKVLRKKESLSTIVEDQSIDISENEKLFNLDPYDLEGSLQDQLSDDFKLKIENLSNGDSLEDSIRNEILDSIDWE